MSTSATGPDIYNYLRRLQLALQNLQNNAKISARNRRLIVAFHERSTAEGLSTPRLVRHIHILSKLAEGLGKSFETARREDITPSKSANGSRLLATHRHVGVRYLGRLRGGCSLPEVRVSA